MKTIELERMTIIQGGDNIDEFCIGFAAVAGIYEVGVLINIWNPVGWTAGAIGVTIGASCALYALS